MEFLLEFLIYQQLYAFKYPRTDVQLEAQLHPIEMYRKIANLRNLRKIKKSAIVFLDPDSFEIATKLFPGIRSYLV